jgi:hypothetical protein
LNRKIIISDFKKGKILGKRFIIHYYDMDEYLESNFKEGEIILMKIIDEDNFDVTGIYPQWNERRE